ncbi:hypothetical protein [Agrococcus beijingensis]|uniref:hypothetical protein n=1 Tax=Agrococcus beijingensis TaxID=3068634 RepID=UPI0027429CD9|nr:hypothetical protein [Agrococcus sp. REN33]
MSVHRGRRLEDWVELAAAAVERAKRSLGDQEVARRVEASVSDEDYETTVRVLRTMGRDLQASAPDLSALDARLRGHVEPHPHVPEVPEEAPAATSELAAERGPASETDRPDKTAQATLDDLPIDERGSLSPMEVAKQLARLRNPILPHPRRGRAR